jgi:hypothetical protein
MPRAFVVRPFGTKKDSSGVSIDFERIHKELIKPALIANGLSGNTTGEIVDAGNIREDMFALILEADVIVCDITVHNANVFYELGIRHALRKKSTLMVRGTPTADSTPFDLLTDRYLAYDIDDPGAALSALSQAIADSMASSRLTDSPVFQMVPALPEADSEKVQAVPPDFQQEVERAAAAKSKGWLRLLSREVQGRRFERSALKLVGQAQWKIRDYPGAVTTFETIRTASATAAKDVDANLALANIFERQSQDQLLPADRRAALLVASDQAIENVVTRTSITRAQQAEALALKGRNQKTHWRLSWSAATDVASRRHQALKRSLIESYESYVEAFHTDLNRFWPGLAAVQMGTILLELSNDSGWNGMFTDDRRARNYREELADQVPKLAAAVALSVQVAITRLAKTDPDRLWAIISDADMSFLTNDRDDRVAAAYEAAFRNASPFDWDAARRQLQLFADIGIKVERVSTIIERVEGVLGEPARPKTTRPLHVVIFAGHQFDEPHRDPPRLPATAEPAARAAIKAKMQQLHTGTHELVLLGSVSPGADVLWHEVCAEIGLPSIVCLPMPVADHGRTLFAATDSLRSRFLDIVSPEQKRRVLTLSDQAGLPKWLVPTQTDPWGRGNAWVIEMANSWGGERVTLVVLWDGKPAATGDAGTSHLVELARQTGTIRIEPIDVAPLLARETRET